MDLRTKLVFGLVAVSLASMLALGTLAYRNSEALIDQRSAVSLSSIAEAKAAQVESVAEGWEEAVGLLASRTQLRSSLAGWNQARSPREQERIAGILSDARSASRLVEGVAVFDLQGQRVASSGVVEPGWESVNAGRGDDRGVALLGFTGDDPPRAAYAAELQADGAHVGVMVVLLTAGDLAAVAANRAGLGDTGEVLIAVRTEGGEIRLLTPLRHPASAGIADAADTTHTAAPGASIEQLMHDALQGLEGPITGELTDYRGEPIWAAMRRIEAADLALLLKFDEAEERADIVELRGRLLGVGLSLAAFAILLGVAMGFMFARPINALGAVACRIRDGDLSARADAGREDEIGLLAETFNSMGEELERRMEVLQEFKTFFDESKDMLCIAGTDGYFKRVNPAFTRTLGWAEEELLGRPFVEFVHPEDVDATIRETEQLASGTPTISFTNRYRCKDGTWKHLHWTSHPDPGTGNIYASARSGSDMLMT
jgi:PAS domain S-box-containing protein